MKGLLSGRLADPLTARGRPGQSSMAIRTANASSCFGIQTARASGGGEE